MGVLLCWEVWEHGAALCAKHRYAAVTDYYYFGLGRMPDFRTAEIYGQANLSSTRIAFSAEKFFLLTCVGNTELKNYLLDEICSPF